MGGGGEHTSLTTNAVPASGLCLCADVRLFSHFSSNLLRLQRGADSVRVCSGGVGGGGEKSGPFRRLFSRCYSHFPSLIVFFFMLDTGYLQERVKVCICALPACLCCSAPPHYHHQPPPHNPPLSLYLSLSLSLSPAGH